MRLKTFAIVALLALVIGAAWYSATRKNRGDYRPQTHPGVGSGNRGAGSENQTSEVPGTSAEAAQETATQRRIAQQIFAAKPNIVELAADADEARVELERLMAIEKDPCRLDRILAAYDVVSLWTGVQITPECLRRILRDGPIELRIRALDIAARISDDWSADFISTLIAAPASGADAELLLRSALKSAGRSHSDRIADALTKYIQRDDSKFAVVAIESIGNAGSLSAMPALQSMVERPPNPIVKAEAAFALEKIALLGDPDRDSKLLEAVRGSRMSGEFSWYDWALDWIVSLKLTHTAGPLRSIYDEQQHLLDDSGPFSFRVRILSAINQLGGPISADELALLRRCGRIR